MPESKEVFSPEIDATTATTQEMFGKILQRRIQEGALEKAITENVDRLINDAASDVFKSYGDVGKAIKEQMTKSLMPRLESIDDLPNYSNFVTNRLKLAAQDFHDQKLAKVIDDELKEVFSEIPEEITLKWLVEKMLSHAQEYNEDQEGEITLIIDVKDRSWGGYISVYMDNESDKDKHQCDYDLHLSKEKDTNKYSVLGLKVNGDKVGDRLTLGRMYGFDKVLMNIYAMKGFVSIDSLDADDYTTYWDNYD